MDHPLVIFALFVLTLVLLDLVALRFAADSRRPRSNRRDW